MIAWTVFVFVGDLYVVIYLSMLTEGPPEPDGNIDCLCFFIIFDIYKIITVLL